MRILQIGDLHSDQWSSQLNDVDEKDPQFSKTTIRDIRHERLRNVLRRIHELSTSGEVDGVALMGDYTSRGCQKYLRPAISVIDTLCKDPDGNRPIIAGVPGNHDVAKLDAKNAGKSGKFYQLRQIFREFGWVGPPIDDCVEVPIGETAGARVSLALLNTSIGSWSKHLLSTAISEQFEDEKLSSDPIPQIEDDGQDYMPVSIESANQTPIDREEQLFTQLDTPYVSRRALQSLDSRLNKVNSNSICIIAHHNLLPQRIPRILAYGELINGGAFRQYLLKKSKNIIYLHGHIHEDPLEIISSPPSAPGQPESKIISISAPLITDGFNEIAFFVSHGDLFLIRVTKYRPDTMQLIGNFSDQESIYIPVIKSFSELITGVGRQVWQVIKERGILNWDELKEHTSRLELTDDDLELTVLKLFCCQLVKVNQFGRTRDRWTIERLD